jgi:hypothetical protein
MMKIDTHATRWAKRLRLNFGESRLAATSLLARVDKALRLLAGKPGGENRLRAALWEAFREQTVEGESLRADVIVAVEGGEMRPSKAEAWAEIFGWNRFAAGSNQASFDPMNEAYWTLGMTAAWVRWHDRATPTETWNEKALTDDEMAGARAHLDFSPVELEFGDVVVDWSAQDRARTINQLRRCSPEYISRSTRWIETEDGGYVLGPREDRGWSDIPGECTDTKHRLVHALKNGSLVVECYRDGKFTPIRHPDWSALRIVGFHDDTGVCKVIAPDGIALDGVRVTRGSIMDAFPSPLDVVAVHAHKRKLTLAELKKYVEQSRYDDGQLMGADAIEKQMKKDNLTANQKRKNIREHVEELTGGRRPGRLEKSAKL